MPPSLLWDVPTVRKGKLKTCSKEWIKRSGKGAANEDNTAAGCHLQDVSIYHIAFEYLTNQRKKVKKRKKIRNL
jgi:hypothetical protein